MKFYYGPTISESMMFTTRWVFVNLLKKPVYYIIDVADITNKSKIFCIYPVLVSGQLEYVGSFDEAVDRINSILSANDYKLLSEKFKSLI